MPRKGPRTKEQNERAAKQKKARQQKKKEEEEKAKQEKRAKDAERKRRQRANQKAREEAAAKAEAAMDPNQPHIPPTPDTPKPVETPVHLRGTYTATPRQSSVAVRRTPWSQSATRTPNHGGPTTREAAMTVAANLMSASKDTAKSVESEGDKNREAQLSIATNLASVASKLADVSANLASASKDQQSFMASEAEKNRQAQLRCLEIAENAPDDEDDFEQPQYIATNDENFEQIATDLNSRFTAASNQFEPIKEEEDEEEDDKKMSGVDLSAGDDDEELVPKTDDERTKNEKQEEVFTTTESSPTKMNSSENETSPTAKKTPTTSGTPFYMFGSETPSNSATTFGNNATTAPGVRFASNANQPNSNGSIGVGAGFTFGTTTVNTNSTATTPLFFGTTAIPTNTNGPVGINFGTSTGGVTFGATHPTSGSMSQSYTVPTKNPSTNAGQMGSGFVANEITKKMKAGSKLAKRLYSTGSTDAGTLVLSEDDNCGLAEEEDKHLPTEIRKVKDGVGTYDTIVQVETGQDCSFVLYQSGKVYSFGVSGTELARDGSDDDEALQVLPILQYDGVALDDKVFIVKMSAAAGILLLLDKNGRVFFSGSFSDDNNNKFCPPRQVGNIDISYDPTKTSPFILPLGEKKAVDICVSDKIAAIKCQDGSLLSFGTIFALVY